MPEWARDPPQEAGGDFAWRAIDAQFHSWSSSELR